MTDELEQKIELTNEQYLRANFRSYQEGSLAAIEQVLSLVASMKHIEEVTKMLLEFEQHVHELPVEAYVEAALCKPEPESDPEKSNVIQFPKRDDLTDVMDAVRPKPGPRE